MLRNLQQRKSDGFTIIEVMIVLAIAGLIMLIVFLAVPALQRNSRNTQYKNDASNYASAVSEWMNNNNGKVPGDSDLTNVNKLANLGQLTAPTATESGAKTSQPAIGTLEVDVNAKCSTTTVGDTDAITTRSVAIRYSVEDSGGNPVKQCVDV